MHVYLSLYNLHDDCTIRSSLEMINGFPSGSLLDGFSGVDCEVLSLRLQFPRFHACTPAFLCLACLIQLCVFPPLFHSGAIPTSTKWPCVVLSDGVPLTVLFHRTEAAVLHGLPLPVDCAEQPFYCASNTLVRAHTC